MDLGIFHLGTYKPWERRRLLDLAVLRSSIVAAFALALALIRLDQGWPAWLVGVFVPADATLAALISADVVEDLLKARIFGYTYNPNVFSRGALEGSNTIMDARHETVWRQKMFTRLAIGDDPGSGHYDYPHGVAPGDAE